MSESATSGAPTVRILIIDDNPADAELVRAELRRARLQFTLTHCDNRRDLIARLDEDPDVVLTDFIMPNLSGLEVIELVRAQDSDLPVIIVSGSIGEDLAVTAMKEGAFDYLLKDRLSRLAQAVQRAVSHRKLRREHREAAQTNARLVSIIESNPDLVAIADADDRLIFLNQAGRNLVGLPGEQIGEGLRLREILPIQADVHNAEPPGRVFRGESILHCSGQRGLPVAYTLVAHEGIDGGPTYRSVVTRDLTERKQAEDRIAALLRISHRLNASLEMDTLLEGLVREALFLLDAEGGCAGVREGDELRTQTYLTRDSRRDFVRAWQPGAGLPGWVLEHRAPYLSNVVANDPQCAGATSPLLDLRQALCMPICNQTGEVIGFFEIHNKRSGDFETADTELMQSVAQSAAVALANVLAYRQVEEARRQLSRHVTGLREIVALQQEMDAEHNTVDEMVKAVLNRLGRLIQAAGAVIALREGDEMVYRSATGTAAGQVGLRLGVFKSLSGICVRENRSLVCENTEADPRVDLDACRRVGARSMILVPFSMSGRVRGVLKAYSSRPAAFDDSDRQLLEILSGLLGTSLQRKLAEESLRRSERDFRVLFASNPLPMWVFDAETLRFLAVNDAAIRHYGYTREEFLAMDISRIRPAEDVPRVLELARSRRAQGSRELHRHLRKDGTLIIVEISWDPIEFDGRSAKIVLANDVTKQKEAEFLVAEQARLIDLATDAVIVRDLEDRIKFWSKGAERIYGWTAEEVLGEKLTPLITTDLAAHEEALRQLLNRGEWMGELPELNKDGGLRTIQSRWTLVRDKKGRPQSILGIKTDVTEQKKLEAQFLRAQRMESIGTLAGGVAHDLNNVLAPILMSIQLMRMKTEDERLLALLRTIEVSAQRGAGIVKQVLTFARGAQGERTPLIVSRLIADLETGLLETFPKNIAITVELASDLWSVLGDSTQLHQVLLNLCVNARDAMPHGGELKISAANITVDEAFAAQSAQLRAGSYVCLLIEDTGTGMPREIVDRIFDPFFTTKGPDKGTGLGLSTVQAIVKSHEGTINVYSEPGVGTTFKVYLPAQETAGPEQAADESADIPRGQGEGVLVVDDESSIRAIATQILEAFGYSVYEAGNGAEAIALLAQHRGKIDLVLTDVMMPIMDGIATVRAAIRVDPKLIFIVTSGHSANGNSARAANAGVRHFLAKPYSAPELLRAVHTALAAREATPPGAAD